MDAASPSSPTNRTARALGLWLIVGAVVNVLAAWTVGAILHQLEPGGMPLPPGMVFPVVVPMDRRVPDSKWQVLHWWGDSYGLLWDESGSSPASSVPYRELIHVYHGVPFRALTGFSDGWSEGFATPPRTRVWMWTWVYGPFAQTHEFPIRPLWPGFALNTLFYAALAWGLWQLPLAIRRRRRRSKGLCMRCGYDLKGIGAGSACPECGSVPRM